MGPQEQQSNARRPRLLFWVEAILAGGAGLLAVVTIVSRDWIEELFGVDPDGGDGSLEGLIVAAFALVTVVLAVLARVEWRRTQLSRG